MDEVRIESIEKPFTDRELAWQAVRLMTKAEAMGLLEGLQIRTLDRRTFGQVLDRLAERGIGRELRAWFKAGPDQGQYLRMMTEVMEALEDSAVPDAEWGALHDVFDDERLAELVDVAPASVRRYRAGSRETPDAVAARLHFIASVVGDLAGAYNAIGIRRWFERPRERLGGEAPADLLREDWDPSSEEAQSVRALARSLVGAGAT